MTYIDTVDSPDFCYFAISRRTLNISVTASHDARIELRSHLQDSSNFYQIVLGAEGNTKSFIRRSNEETNLVEADTDSILSDEEECTMEIQWLCNGFFRVKLGYVDVEMSFTDREPFLLAFLGLGTTNGANGRWMIEGIRWSLPAVIPQLIETSSYWLTCSSDEEFPKNAVAASDDGLFIGRVQHANTVTPGSVRSGLLQISWDCRVHEKTNFQVLCRDDISWARGWGGSVPLHALAAGETEDGCPLFVGRVRHEGTYYIGKIQATHHTCYIAFGGQEKSFDNYEVLILGSNLIELIDR